MKFLKNQKAFGLIEVLISSIIMATALMALASLQVQAIRGVKQSSNQSIAVMIAEDIASKMLSNQPELLRSASSAYVTPFTTSRMTVPSPTTNPIPHGVLNYTETTVDVCRPATVLNSPTANPLCNCIGDYTIQRSSTYENHMQRASTTKALGRKVAQNDLVRIKNLLLSYQTKYNLEVNADIEYNSTSHMFEITVMWKGIDFSDSSVDVSTYKLFL